MRFKKRDISGVAVVDIAGNLVADAQNADAFHGFFRELLDEGYSNVVVNLKQTPWATSQGIGMLIGANTSVRKTGGELVLVHAEDRIQNILTVTKLNLIFPTLETEEDAIEYFTGSRSLLTAL